MQAKGYCSRKAAKLVHFCSELWTKMNKEEEKEEKILASIKNKGGFTALHFILKGQKRNTKNKPNLKSYDSDTKMGRSIKRKKGHFLTKEAITLLAWQEMRFRVSLVYLSNSQEWRGVHYSYYLPESEAERHFTIL